MGLEMVGIVMDVEKEFGIYIDEEANIRTIGKLRDYVLDRLNEKESHSCLSTFVFLKLRRMLIDFHWPLNFLPWV